MFAIGGLGDLETVYNYRLIWRLFDVVVKPLQDCIFIPGEVILNSLKNELARRQLSLSSYYNADGVILETSGPFSKRSSTKKNTDHIKAVYGLLLLAMLKSIAFNYCYADLDLFKKLKVYFIQVADDRIRLQLQNRMF
ncbi:hypothetical protein PS15p_207908 [Mucor circinelloides]